VQGESGAGQPKLSHLIGHFVGHVALGMLGFIVLAIPAVCLSIAAHYLAEAPVSRFVIEVLLWVHYSLLIVDTVMFAAYILVSIYGATKELIRYARGL
jgi:hypothetical protein